MLNSEQLIRRGTAALVSSVLFGFIMLASLAACPFLMGDNSQTSDHSCCPRKAASEKQCPGSDNLASCPYFLTEAKLGKTEAKFSPGGLAPALASPGVDADLNVAAIVVTNVDHTDHTSAIYLRNRVLRI